ncbi:TfoX/Sxy family protein [Pedobacter frigoris]|uniref:TfoX/Sxy family protein n=1 Tax=Pedobacter frigoris TaxID=2571272 RepID=UPI002930101C|nr:TfoX/Sxy family protein [Pedobacter frigoris]
MKRIINEQVADRVREILVNEADVEEKTMFSGHCFLVNGKMCICVNQEELLCRIGHEQVVEELEKGNARQMVMNGRASKDFVYVALADITSGRELAYWIDLCLQFNPQAKASKKKKK